ncbi:hypothetical protein BASA81_000889 [Batrachochytrium salamandrivorans]|nr:hypothetical protein BASA81_000889 [Batrachochytrium salamandrivorans]
MFKSWFAAPPLPEEGGEPIARRRSSLSKRFSGMLRTAATTAPVDSEALGGEISTTTNRRRLIVSQSFKSRTLPLDLAVAAGMDQEDLARTRALTSQYERDGSTSNAGGEAALSTTEMDDLGLEKQIWIEREPWELADVVAFSKDKTRVTVLLPSTGQIINALREETRGFDRTHLSSEIADLGLLNDLHEASTLSVLQQRFLHGKTYTTIGQVLISLNPYEQLPNAFPVPYTSSEPHLFQVTKSALEDVSGKSHSILINGESGAGKTESAKQCMRYLSQSTKSLNSTIEGAEVRRAVTQTTPLLEAFGNAKTVKNSNSSRFGRYVQLLLGNQSEICGSIVSNFLIETNRVCAIPNQERNFHIFYYLVIGLDTKRKQQWHLSSNPNDYAYLQGFTFESSTEDDELAKKFLETSAALESVGALDDERNGIWSVLALILKLGDITFVENEDGKAMVVSGVSQAASVLESTPELLGKALTVRQIETGRNKEITEIPMNLDRAEYSRDGLAKVLYSKLFDWIVYKANQGTQPKSYKSFIGVLDMMGFEILTENSFEQLLINYSSEVLQSIFNDSALAGEKKLYIEEGVDSSQLVLNDNSNLLQLFVHGVFSILDDITILGGTDEIVLGKLADKNRTNPDFCLDQFHAQSQFIIKHFAGPVQYTIVNFVEKNKGTFFNTLGRLVQDGNGFIARELVQSLQQQRGGTVSKQFRDNLDRMMQVILQTECHFIRCIRPNMMGLARKFDAMAVNDQLLRLGVLEAVRLRREGFPIRVHFAELPKRYPTLLPSPLEDIKVQCEEVLIAGLGLDTKGVKWQLGTKSQVFLSARAFLELDLEVHRRQVLEEQRVAKLAKEERDRLNELARLERERLEQLERDRLAEIQRKRLEQEEMERLRLEEEARQREIALELQRQKLEEERMKLERIRAEELRMRLENERLEAQRAEEERVKRNQAAIQIQSVARMQTQIKSFRVLITAERARVKELKRLAQLKQQAREKAQREYRASVHIQAFIRASLVRKRYQVLKSKRQAYAKCLRPNEIVVKDSLVVRVVVNDLFRAADQVFKANGKLNTAAQRLPDSMNHKKRYQLLLTRSPTSCSLVIVTCNTCEIKDEIVVLDESNNVQTRKKKAGNVIKSLLQGTASLDQGDAAAYRLIAVSSSSRDFIVAKHKTEWDLCDLQGNALSWVALLKDDGKQIPTTLELLTGSFYAQEKIAFIECETSKIIVKQGAMLVQRLGVLDKKPYWEKRWLVLDEDRLQLFKGQSNPYAERELVFSDDVQVRVESSQLFKLALVRNEEELGENMQFRLQCNTQQEFEDWVFAFGVAADRAKKQLTQANAAAVHHPLQQRALAVAKKPTLVTTSATASALPASAKKKFDANAFKSAFKEADKATLANNQ